MSLNINFYSSYKNFIEEPKPSLSHIPEEYKKMEKFYSSSPNTRTVKKCIPFLDSLTCGYIIPFPVDLHFRYDLEKQQAIFEINELIPEEIRGDFLVDVHNQNQISNELRYVHRTVEAIFKFSNPWLIETPPGYSCIFTQPFNRNFPFKIIDGIVDTDSYNQIPVNFPFYWTNSVENTYILKKGTPMVLVIPFKRDSWKMNIKIKKDVDEYKKKLNFFSKIYDNYRNNSWSKKVFR